MELSSYLFPLVRETKKSITHNVELLQKLMQSLSVTELLFSQYSNTGTLFVYSEKDTLTVEKVKDDLKHFFGLKNLKISDIKLQSGQDAVLHLLNNANGINGENQIGLIQSFADDLNLAKKAATIGPVFQMLFQRSIWLHEKVRMKTNYFNYPTDSHKIFCELTEKIFDSVSKIVVQVNGYNKNIIKHVQSLYNFGCRKFIFEGSDSDYTKLSRALHFSGLVVRGSGKLSTYTDVLISCTNNNSFVCTEKLLALRMSEKSNAPFLILNIEEGPEINNPITKSFNVYSYTLSDLDHIVQKNKDARSKILKEIQPWIEKEVNDFYNWLSGRERFHFADIIGQSPKMQEMFELISRISQTDISVLIQGDSGTGKELVSHAVHNLSSRADKPFVVVNCGAIPENLIESELFGHLRGSFTGAVSNKKGLFYDADKGTILLDEIGELPQQLQVKLLRFLQEGDIKPVGSNETIKVNVRVLAATNKNLMQMVEQGTFRSDLFYRLNVILLEIPSLSKRKEDIPLLAEFFLNKYAQRFNKDVREISEEALANLLEYHWPGNVRELENAIEHGVALSLGKQLALYDLPNPVKNLRPFNSSPIDMADSQNGVTKLKDIEKIHIIKILNTTSWDYEKACSVLGIGRTTLWRKIKEYEIKQ